MLKFVIDKMNKYLIIFAVLLSAMICSCKQENSQWRGEARDGVYHETGLLKSWPEGGPALLWSFEGLGEGFTSPAIANKRLYITGLQGNELVLYVFDLNGQLLTKKEVGTEEDENYPGPRSTVVVNDGKLYIYNSFGRLLCLDAQSLNQVWAREIMTDYGGRNIDWNFTESPLIVGDKIFITPGGERHNIVALNKNTGEHIWSSPGMGKVSAYCSPQFIDGYSIPILVTSTAEFIVGVNADTGELLWSHPQTHEYEIHPNTPLYYNGMVLSTSGYGVGTTMLRLKDGGKAIDLVWHNEDLDNQMGGAIRIENHIYSGGHFKRGWACIDWNTGETKYMETNVIGGCNVISADGMLYAYSNRGNVYLVKPNPNEAEIVSSFPITLGTAQHWAHLVIHNGVLYVRHGDALMAYNIKN